MGSALVVGSLWRYPVKSMLGEEVPSAAHVGERGLAGDRGYALIDDETGLVVSAKNPRRWGSLFSCSSRYLEEPTESGDLPAAEITLADGRVVRTTDADANDVLSAFLGRGVRLSTAAPPEPELEELMTDVEAIPPEKRNTVARGNIAFLAPVGTFFDAASINVVTTAALRSLSLASPSGSFDVRRFRPNIVVESAAEGFPENDWVHHRLNIGSTRLDAVLATPRCVMTTLPQPDLPHDKGILQTIGRENRRDVEGLGLSSCLGIYATVASAGTITVGDAVEIGHVAPLAPA